MQLYVISEHQNGPCKIGFAADPVKRMRTLQEANPRSLGLEFQIEVANYRVAERFAHHFAGWRNHLHGEWFNIPVAHAVSAVKRAAFKSLGPQNRR